MEHEISSRKTKPFTGFFRAGALIEKALLS